MKTINSRDELLSFVETNFGYLITNGFQIVDVKMPDSMSWAVTFEGSCQICIEWNWHDGISTKFSESAKGENKSSIAYDVDILVYYIIGRKTIEQYYDDTNMDNDLNNIKPYAQFLLTHLDRIVEFVSGGRFEKERHQVEQARQALIDLQFERIQKHKH